MALRTLLTALSCAAALALAACGDDEEPAATTPPAADAPATTETEVAGSDGPCRAVDAPEAKEGVELEAPTERLDRSKTWTAEVTTNCGSFTIELDVQRAPKTAASFAHLAREGFFDGLGFHRIVPGFVIQGGDPLGDGTGGPGYSVEEAPPRDLQYTKGVVAMAKTGAEPPGTSGSQFYVVTGENAGLPPEYALVGEVTEGMETIEAIEGVPLESQDPNGAPPVDPVVMESVEVSGS